MAMRARMKQGFTLVEVIVVLVVLGILAAIAVPAMTGFIDRANQKRLVVACRTCVNAAQTLASEAYGLNGVETTPATAEIAALAEVPGVVSSVSFLKGTVQIGHLIYTEDGDSVTYCADLSEHPEHYNFKSGGGTFTKEQLDTIYNTIVSIKDANLDSGAAAYTNTTLSSPLLISKLQEAGLDLASLNAASWAYRNNNSEPCFYWSDIDISGFTEDTVIPAMRYNYKTGTFTVWNMSVKANYTPSGQNSAVVNYPIINNTVGTVYNPNNYSAADQTSEHMLEDYAAAKDAYLKNTGS